MGSAKHDERSYPLEMRELITEASAALDELACSLEEIVRVMAMGAEPQQVVRALREIRNGARRLSEKLQGMR